MASSTCLHLQAYVPRLLQQEKFIFDELVSYVWTHTFVPSVAASRAKPAQAALAAGEGADTHEIAVLTMLACLAKLGLLCLVDTMFMPIMPHDV